MYGKQRQLTAAELIAEEADEITDAAELEALAMTEAAEDAAEVTASEALTAWAEIGVLMLTLAVVVAGAVDAPAPALELSAALKLSFEIPNWVESVYCVSLLLNTLLVIPAYIGTVQWHQQSIQCRSMSCWVRGWYRESSRSYQCCRYLRR
jgi:hypothetical protein